jgi:Ca-activated chloride channel family protein
VRIRALAASLVLAAAASLSPLRAEPPAPAAAKVDATLWPEAQRSFYEDGPGLLLTDGERAELAAADDAGRQRFIDAFLARDPRLARAIANRRAAAAVEFPSPKDVRSQLIFLNGPPTARLVVDCGTAFKPLEVWTYRRGAEGGDGRLVIYRPTPGEPFRAWQVTDSKRVLYSPEMEYWLEQWEELRGRISGRRFDRQVCKEAEAVDRATGLSGLTGARAESSDELLSERRQYGRRPGGAAGEGLLDPPGDLAAWVRRAEAETVAAAAAALAVPAVELYFPERQGQRILTRVVLSVIPKGRKEEPPPEGVEGAKATVMVNLIVDGVVEAEGKIFEEFRLRYRLPAPPAGEPVALAIDRALRPRFPFVLRLKIKDEIDGAEARVTRGFSVPAEPIASTIPIPGVPPEGQEAARRVSGMAHDSLTLLPPEGDVVLGLYRAEALVTGGNIVRVGFFVDGKMQLSRGVKPYSVELRLARFPVEQTIRAEGYDAQGKVVSADEIVLNQPRGGLAINIVEPRRGTRPQGKVKARAEITVPEERRITSVEFRVDDKVVASLVKPPWEAVVDATSPEEIVYLTVVAILDDGSRREELRFLKAPQNLEEVQVNLIELYAAVTDGKGDLVRGLTAADFLVLEGGKAQEVDRCQLVENLPLTVGMVLDTSGSMASSLSEAQRAAGDFVHNVVRPGDKVFALSFSDHPSLRMPMTDDVEAAVASLATLQAVGATSLHDALVHSLYYFRGTRGQRALVLLSDGDDTSSQLGFDETLEYARRSGVSIYTIGLKVGISDLGVRSKLSRLADVTGGRTFYVSSATELGSVYAEISRELRSRYLVAFASELPPGSGGYRPVELKMKKPGLKVRSARGYSP